MRVISIDDIQENIEAEKEYETNLINVPAERANYMLSQICQEIEPKEEPTIVAKIEQPLVQESKKSISQILDPKDVSKFVLKLGSGFQEKLEQYSLKSFKETLENFGNNIEVYIENDGTRFLIGSCDKIDKDVILMYAQCMLSKKVKIVEE